MSATSSSSAVFSGNSRYAADFQAVIDRSVAIASLPISQLNNDRAKLEGESAALESLNGKFDALQNAITAIDDSLGSSAYQASLANPSVAGVSLGAGAMEGNYSIEVVRLGSYSTAMSADLGIAEPSEDGLGNAGAVTLAVGGVNHTITPANGSLTALAQAINAHGDAHVRAVVVNVGGAGDPDYRLSLESTRLGAIEIRVLDGTTELVTGQNTGATAQYKVNGVAQIAESDSRTVEIAPGLSVTLLAASGATSIAVTRQSSALSNALASFANSYNAAMEEIDLHRGDGDGALQGHQIVYQLAQSLRELAGFSGSPEAISSLESLGLTFGRDGKLNFNSLAFMSADLVNSGAVAGFLGTPTTAGFLKSATDILEAVQDPLTGRLESEIGSVSSEMSRIDDTIAEQETRVNDLKVQLQERMAAADALIASMEQQYSYLFSMLESMRAASEQY